MAGEGDTTCRHFDHFLNNSIPAFAMKTYKP
jgi:hypothetical protein